MPGRLFRLLALLQSRREWSGEELAERLRVTERTVRRDIQRLRELDYTVTSSTGTAGGYRLVAGRNVPPLKFDEDEVIAIATGLTTAAAGNLTGIDESAGRALAKLGQVLPARLRPQLAAVAGATSAISHDDAPVADPAVLALLASCCRDNEILSFDYSSRDGARSARRVEPHSLVTIRGHWYLLAFDPDRADWRTFRVDRIADPRHTHRHVTPRELPDSDAAGYLQRTFAAATYRHTARITVRLPAETVRDMLHIPILGAVETADTEQCTIRLSANSPELVTQYAAAIASLSAECTLDADEEITRRLRALGNRLVTR